MSLCSSDKEAKWIWFDGNTWQSYDDETNEQIENAYISGKESVKLNAGPHFGKYQNVHRVYFNYNTHPPSFNQINVITKDITQIKRILTFKQVLNHQNNKKKVKKKKKKSKHSNSNKIKTSKQIIINVNNNNNNNNNNKLLSAIERIKVYKHLYNAGFNKHRIDKALKIFNIKFNSNSPILTNSDEIVNELIDIITIENIKIVNNIQITNHEKNEEQGSHPHSPQNNGYLNDGDNDNDNNDDDDDDDDDNGSSDDNNDNLEEEKERKTPSFSMDFKIGAWIEVNINNNWIPGKIIDVNWSSRNTVITIGYQDIFNKRSKQIKLNGSDINRNNVRPLLTTENKQKDGIKKTVKSRFNFDLNDSDPPRSRNGHSSRNGRNGYNGHNSHNSHNGHSPNATTPNGGRFNRTNLSIHRFNFEYQQNVNNKKYDEKNAKHPSEYINRKCFKCKGSGKCSQINNNNNNNNNNDNNNYEIIPCLRCKSTGFAQMACNKCINASGVYRKSYSLIHSKCNGSGCLRCNDSGKYPLHDILCNNCKGSGVYKIKCTLCNNAAIREQIKDAINNISNNNNNNPRYNTCMSGYRLPQLIPFVPKRGNEKLSVHGANNNNINGGKLKGMHNMKRLYHATDREGANGIIQTGVMLRGGDGSYGGGIYFAESAHSAEIKARQKGYLVIADVFIGKCKDEYFINTEMNFNKLHQIGYDSIRGHWTGNGTEFVVYNWDQVWVHVVLPFEQVNFKTLQ